MDWSMRVLAGREAGTTIAVTDEGLVVGRAQEGAGTLGHDPELSRRHARLARGPNGELIVEDLGSTNGTFVNGRRIHEPTEVGAEDTLWMGSTTLTVEADSQATGVQQAEVPPPSAAETGFLSRVMDLYDRHPRRVLAFFAVLFVIAAPLGITGISTLKDRNGFVDPASESAKTDNLLSHAAGTRSPSTLLVMVQTGAPAASAAARARVAAVASAITAQSQGQIKGVLTTYSTHNAALVSRSGTLQALPVLVGDLGPVAAQDVAKRVRSALKGQAGVLVGGAAIANVEMSSQISKDLGTAEGIAIPILFIAALFVFRGVVAALLPIIIGVLTIFVTFLCLRLINLVQHINPFAVNVVTALGLGLSIDYSLFVLSRYREELARVGKGGSATDQFGAQRSFEHDGGRPRTFPGSEHEALRRTLYTAGRTIFFSAVTVALALAALCIFRQPFLYSMGIGGAMSTIVAVTLSLTCLPALLAVLGPRVNALAPKRWQRSNERIARQERDGFWYRHAQRVMRHPLAIAIVTAAVLIALGIPFWGVKFTGVDAHLLPPGNGARTVADLQQQQFPGLNSDVERVAVLPPASSSQVAQYTARLSALPGVARAQGPVALPGGVYEIDVVPNHSNLSSQTLSLVKQIRSEGSASFPVRVTGPAAEFIDQKHSISTRLPFVLGVLAILTMVVLFLMTGSVVLPVKSIIMNLLTLSAAFGILVLIFQDGHLQGLLGFSSPKALDLTQPVLLFCIAFGLSTDYAVFLLTRIKEARDRGAADDDAVAIGLERSGRIVTQAALLFCIALAAFCTSSVVFIKEVGLGAALAVLIDASIVRAFLVPALMKLLGRRNWWAPGPLRRLHARIGLSEM
jgi:uncharacterized membrane protein YdfJ with MMPL/SSD domain